MGPADSALKDSQMAFYICQGYCTLNRPLYGDIQRNLRPLLSTGSGPECTSVPEHWEMRYGGYGAEHRHLNQTIWGITMEYESMTNIIVKHYYK